MKPYYERDGITLFHCDCRELLPTLAAGSVDAVITDPPYGMDLQPQRGKVKAIEGDIQREAKALWWAVVPQCFRLLKNDSASVFFGRWSEEWAKTLLAEWFTVKGCIVWVKNNFGIGYYLRPQWELAWYVHKGEPPTPERAGSDVWQYAKVQDQVHSCEKPIDMMERAVELCGGGLILDPFCGSGPTLVAAWQAGSRAIGFEISEEHCETTATRLDRRISEGRLFVPPSIIETQSSLFGETA